MAGAVRKAVVLKQQFGDIVAEILVKINFARSVSSAMARPVMLTRKSYRARWRNSGLGVVKRIFARWHSHRGSVEIAAKMEINLLTLLIDS